RGGTMGRKSGGSIRWVIIPCITTTYRPMFTLRFKASAIRVIARRILEVTSPLDDLLYACHPRLVNGNPRPIRPTLHQLGFATLIRFYLTWQATGDYSDFEDARTIAKIPARIASGNSGQAATTAARSGSSRVTKA